MSNRWHVLRCQFSTLETVHDLHGWSVLCAHLESEQRCLLQRSLDQLSFTSLHRPGALLKGDVPPPAGRCTTLNDSAYTWGQGTSMAAPHVAGVAAM